MPTTAKKSDDAHDTAQTYQDFKDAVNMSASEIEKWLDTDDSKAVGFVDEGDSEAVGHKSGKRIVEILGTKKADLANDDYAHMRKVVSYVHRHMAQGPHDKADIKESRWRFSLMNWGHDPLQK